MCKHRKLDLIVKRLREYPFTEKMLFCQAHSTRMMTPTNLDILNTPNAVYPWELEVFAELSLFASGDKTTKHINQTADAFVSIINEIRNYQHPHLKSQKNLSYADSLIMISGLQQFKAQENILDRLYRYNYFWNFSNDIIDMPNEFSTFFNGLSYEHFRDLGILIFFYAALKEGDVAQIISYVNIKYKAVVDNLTISRNKYKDVQSEKLDDNFENTIYGFNYLHPYPYVECQGFVFLPLPYLIIDAVTDSLLTRITIDNNALRETIGKEVAQSYIESIFREGNVYDEILPEQEYYVGKNKIDTPDILIKNGDDFCLIDSKLSTPKLELRKFNKEAISDTISRYAKNIIQVYKRILDFTNGYYYPFSAQTKVEKNNVFGIVALLEDSYISRRQIYQEVFLQLKLDPESEEAKFIKANISITSFHDLELFAFGSRDIFVALKEKQANQSNWNNLQLFNMQLYPNKSSNRLDSMEKFISSAQSLIMKTIDELVGIGIVKK